MKIFKNIFSNTTSASVSKQSFPWKYLIAIDQLGYYCRKFSKHYSSDF